MFNWRDPLEFDAYVQAQRKWGLDCACITLNKGVRGPGCSLTDPADREGFLTELHAAIEAGKKVGAKRLVVLSGMEREGVSRAEQMDSCVATLKVAAPILEKNGVQLCQMDVGDVSWVVPTTGFGTASWVPGTPAHSWQAVAAGGTEIGRQGMMLAARVLAATAWDLFHGPDTLRKAKDEHNRRRSGANYKAMLEADQKPPLDYRNKPK